MHCSTSLRVSFPEIPERKPVNHSRATPTLPRTLHWHYLSRIGYGLIFLMLIRKITSWPRQRVPQPCQTVTEVLASTRPFWIAHVKHDSHRQLSNTTRSIVIEESIYFHTDRFQFPSKRYEHIVHNESSAVMLYKPFSTCTRRACTRSCVWMDLGQW